jgi:hypothetical protein
MTKLIDDIAPEEKFVEILCQYHAALLRGQDQEVKSAVIIKMVALTALAFGIAPTEDAAVDIDEQLEKLRMALTIIAQAEWPDDRPHRSH